MNWHTCIPSFDIPLMERRVDNLYKYLNFFKENGFKIIPNDTVPRNTLMDLNILGLELKTGSLSKLIGPEAYKVIEFANAEASDSITIRSCPFSFTNPLLFSDFLSVGESISRQLKIMRHWAIYPILNIWKTWQEGLSPNPT